MASAGAAAAQQHVDRMKQPAAAEYLGVSEQTLARMRSEGKGPRYVKLGGRVFYRRTDLEAYIESNTFETDDSRKSAA